jgi:HD superfamily phosphohydrolase
LNFEGFFKLSVWESKIPCLKTKKEAIFHLNMLHVSKIINDPVHGFIEIPSGLILSLINHPAYQRLRRIRQLGLSVQVYPGATHSRFLHALGAMHLMTQALDTLRKKHIPISDAEYEGALIAILLHDIGHGPFSHGLEKEILQNVHHEEMSFAIMEYLNEEFEGKLSLAIAIFSGTYAKPFLHQLVSSQLDMDRMDYLMRDSFFTGVVEGVIGADRIIKTLNVLDNRLVVESKGIYSVEKFIVARRLMYWQVYLHKAAIASEQMLIHVLRRARELVAEGKDIFLGDMLGYFFKNKVTKADLTRPVLTRFLSLDDTDVIFAIKQWQHAEDRVLAMLAQGILHRNLLKITLRTAPFSEQEIAEARENFCKKTGLSIAESSYFIFSGSVTNQAYAESTEDPILIWYKDGEIKNISSASDMENVHALSGEVVRYFLSRTAPLMP